MICRRSLALGVLIAMVATLVPFSQRAAAISPDLVISQVYGGGGNTGAPFQNDFIELFNRGTTGVSVAGWSVQYASATGFAWQATNLPSVTVPAGGYLLVRESAGSSCGGLPCGVPLPAADATGSIAMSATAAKVALVNNTTALSGSCISGPMILDLVGYGLSASCYEGVFAPDLSNTTADLRAGNGCVDTDDNSADFRAGAPAPRNASSPIGNCSDQAPEVSLTAPANGASGVPTNANVNITFSEPVNATGSWFAIACAASGGHTAAQSGGPTTFTLDPTVDFASLDSCTVTVFAAMVSDQDSIDPPDNMAADYSFTFTTVGPSVRIHEIQGAGHGSPLVGQNVSNIPGVVTAKRSNGFYMQDPNPDADPATSEGIFVFTSSAPSSVSGGDAVTVNGRVSEFRPGGAGSANLTTTEIVSPTTTVGSHGNPLPPATVIGNGGRIPPSQTLEDDATGDVETSGIFDPASDGLDFWESLEGMRVQLNNAVAVGPTNRFGETPVVGDDGANASIRTARGGLVIRATDFNPERIVLDDQIVPNLPRVNVGDHYVGSVRGVLDYNFGNFMIELTEMPAVVRDGVTPEMTAAVGTNELAIATFNVQNLDPTDPQSKFDRLAGLIVNNLKSPDVISVEEVQDNTGPADDGTVDAGLTLSKLIAAIQAAGGPAYEYRQIDPANDQDGGEPGGNIRQVFLFRTDRGLSFVDRPGGGSAVPTTVVNTPTGPQLSSSPGRIDPTNSAWTTSRKPLAGEFTFNTHHVFVIANHFNSKGGDQPLMGRFQPPTRSSEVQRHQQAQIVHDFVDQILAADPNANVVVDGDLNDFEFSDAVSILTTILVDLVDTLPQNERYSYVFEGNSQTLDHILVSDALFNRPLGFDIVHVNSEFFDQASDHDPSVARITLNDPPTASAGGPYGVDEGGSIQVSASGADPEGGPLTYAWDLDGDGTFETPGAAATFSAASLDGPGTRTVTARVTDAGGLTATDSVTISIRNVPPTAVFHAPGSAAVGFGFTLSLIDPSDPSAADTAAGFSFAFDCGTGFGTFGASSSISCLTTDVGDRLVAAKIKDKDGGISEYRATVHVVVTFDSLCALTRSYARNPSVADALCAKLDAAGTAPNDNARVGVLNAFRNQVDGQTGAEPGKSFVLDEAAILKRLSLRLQGL